MGSSGGRSPGAWLTHTIRGGPFPRFPCMKRPQRPNPSTRIQRRDRAPFHDLLATSWREAGHRGRALVHFSRHEGGDRVGDNVGDVAGGAVSVAWAMTDDDEDEGKWPQVRVDPRGGAALAVLGA